MFSTEMYITEDEIEESLRIEIFRYLDNEYRHESVKYTFIVNKGYTTKEPEDIYYYDIDSGLVVTNERRYALNVTSFISTIDYVFTLDKEDTWKLFNLLDLDYIIRESEPK